MEGAVITVGTFDGLHLGHQAILQQLQTIAREKNLPGIAYTFAFPPRHAIRYPMWKTQPPPCLLLPQSAKRKLLEQYVDRVEPAEFAAVKNLSAKQFIHNVLLEQFAARTIVVGESFQFGRDREGKISLLRQIGEKQGFSVITVPMLIVDHAPVSSSRIRSLIKSGQIRPARPLLGRPPLLVGEVVAGDRLGRKLGYPTANLALDSALLLPAEGIYLIHAFWKKQHSAGLLYLGMRPTLKSNATRCEVYLLSAPGTELYGERMEVHLHQKLRDDQVFPSLEALRRQLDRDVAQARSLLLSYTEDLEPILA